MKKYILFTSLVLVILISCTIFISDGLTYLISSLMALAIVGGIRANKEGVITMTRWAKKNPVKTQVFIAVLVIALMVLGITTGYNLKELGYEFSNTTFFIFTAILVSGFLHVPFLPRRRTIAISKDVNRNRLAYMGIALSAFILMAFTGNRIEDHYPNSRISTVLKTIDQAIFSDDITPYIEFDEEKMISEGSNKGYSRSSVTSAKPVFAALDVRPKGKINELAPPNNTSRKHLKKSKKRLKKANKKAWKEMRKLKKERRKNLRRAAAGGACALAVFLILLLGIAVCAGICMVVLGIGALGSGTTSGIVVAIFAIIAGPFVVWGAVRGIKKVSKWCKND